MASRTRAHDRRGTRRRGARRTSVALGLLVLVGALGLGLRACRPQEPRLVLFISLDTLRADHLGCYGYERATSPHLDRFAVEDALLFENAFTNAPWTLPSHMSMFTGVYPERHGMLSGTQALQLSPRLTTVAERFHSAGYATAAFTDGLYVGAAYGFGRGFDLFEDHFPQGGFRAYGERVRTWLTQNADDDCFLFVHSYDVHGPYHRFEPHASRFAAEPELSVVPRRSLFVPSFSEKLKHLRLSQFASLREVFDAYDSGVAFVDAELGKLFEQVRALGLWENATILVVSDHGEAFLENGSHLGHGPFGERSLLHVPFLLKLPGSDHAGSRVRSPIGLVDTYPTLLRAAGLPVPEPVDGIDALSVVESERDALVLGLVDSLDYHYLVNGETLLHGVAKRPWKALDTYASMIPGLGADFVADDVWGLHQMVPGVPEPGLQPLVDELEERARRAGALRFRPVPRSESAPTRLEDLAALGYLGAEETPDPPTPAPDPRWTRMASAVPVDWDAFVEADEALWLIARIVRGDAPRLAPKALEAHLRATSRALAAIRETRPEQARHVEWRERMLLAARGALGL